jgi:hypothetical protein
MKLSAVGEARSEIWHRRRRRTVKLRAYSEDAELHNLFHELPLNYSPNVRKETMRTLLRRRMTLHAIGECAKRLLAHSPTALSECKSRIYQEIIIQNENFVFSFYLDYMGWIKTKNNFTLLSL